MGERAADRWATRIAGQVPEVELLDPGADAAAPNCPQCLTPLNLAETVDAPRWECPTCAHLHP